MPGYLSWETYEPTYRTEEIQTIAQWISAGESGCVVGLVGCGRSNLLGFLCHRPEVLYHYLPSATGPIALIQVDIYDLPSNDLSNLYRTILYAFYAEREQFEDPLKTSVIDLYLENRATQDPFLSQKALYELLALFQAEQIQVVLVLNRFDRFYQDATPQMINTLRGLRDTYKDTLCYIVGMLQEIAYLPNPAALGGMYSILDKYICWVGAFNDADARAMLARNVHTAPKSLTENEVLAILALSGNFPILINAVAHWWRSMNHRLSAWSEGSLENWKESLLEQDSILFRLESMWNSLNQEEQLVLSEVQKLQSGNKGKSGAKSDYTKAISTQLANEFAELARQHKQTLYRLVAKGLCLQDGQFWWIKSKLLATYVGRMEGRVRGRIWIDEKARQIYQGEQLIEGLTSLQYAIVRFLAGTPRTKQTRDDIIDHAWPEEEQREGITPNALQVHIASIRKKIEPNPTKPRYLLTWHGRPGGYQFFPEGKPS